MNTLEQQHLKAIDEIISHSDPSENKESAEACASITLEFAGKFAAWVDKNAHESEPEEWTCTLHRGPLTMQQLIQLYLSTLQQESKKPQI